MIIEKHKKIDALINNAGITLPNKKSTFYSEKKWDVTLKINLTSHFNCSQAVLKYMKRNNEGSIVNIMGLNAELGFPNNPAYVAAKGGLKMLGKSLARDWGTFGIRINNLGPGYIKTDMTKKSFNNLKISKIVDISITVPSSSTPRIQEAHRTIYHIICEIVEQKLKKC